jgi:apolipoprotein N-acyltransferase
MSTTAPAPGVTPGDPPTDGRRALRWAGTAAGCLAAGACLALSVPPAGFWPLGIVGVAVWDRLLAHQPASRRARRSWLVAVAWLAPMTLWMWDLTAPGYLVATAIFGGWFALAGAAVPPGAGRWVALPGAIVLAEALRWSFPFDGIPLATLAMGQADAPLADAARLGGALAVSGLVAVAGVALSAALARRWRPVAIAAGVVVAATALGAVAPRGEAVGTLDVAAVQGGGEQRTRATTSDPDVVFARHLAASDLVTAPVDLVLWPENVVAVEALFAGSSEEQALAGLARRLDAPVVAGITERVSDTEFLNASVVVLPDGTVGSRYDKVLRVPFGEYVPFRPLIERLAPDAGLPRRDARAGTAPAVLTTPVGPMGIAISWEVFFTHRAADGVAAGGELLLNPTNGSSYWLTQVQTQQVASSQLRAIETGRWVVQAAPTGFSAIVTPDGDVVERTSIGEQAVVQHTVERRRGDTIATRLGSWPVVVLALGAVGLGWWLARRHRTPAGGGEDAGEGEGEGEGEPTLPGAEPSTLTPPREG